jgi:hypothetical protein
MNSLFRQDAGTGCNDYNKVGIPHIEKEQKG